jgi:predicted Zn-dependent protease/preprotein translocase subunit SecE
MSKSKNVPQAVADYINQAQQEMEDLISRQFIRSTLLVVISVLLFFLLYAAMSFLFRAPTNEELIERLDDSNHQISQVAQALLQSGIAPSSSLTSTRALELVLAQAGLHTDALEEVRRTQQQMPAEGLSLVQLLGGSAVLALLGYIGLQRLQNLDVEVQGLRKFMYDQIRERVAEGREVLQASVDDEVDKRFQSTHEGIEQLSREFREDTEHARKRFEKTASDAMDRIREAEEGATALFERYAWLQSPEVRTVADEISGLVSVQEDDRASARLALRRIVEQNLPGSENEFHNTHTQAMTLDDPELGLAIVDAGLRYFPDQYDLMADKARVLISLGKAREARELLEGWRQRKPREFARGWRPVVFYADAVLAGELTPEVTESLEDALDDVCRRLPQETKPWSTYSRFEAHLGRATKAEEIVVEGITHNPYSQELNYVLGELLLQQGRANQSVKYLEAALDMDYQEQYQHSVDQHSVWATLAQAYEAVDKLDEAELLYRSVGTSPEADYHIRQYARNRLAAISLRQGKAPEADSGQDEALQGLLSMLATGEATDTQEEL